VLSDHHQTPRARLHSGRPSTGRLTSPIQERRVLLRGKITKLIASCCIARVVVLAAEDQVEPIVIHIDSPGGSASEAMGILSTINGIRCPVVTVCRGQAAGPAAVIAAHGKHGSRSALSSSRFSFGVGCFSDRASSNFESLYRMLAEVLAKDTGREVEEILEWFSTGAEFGTQEALRKGLIDSVTGTPAPRSGTHS
jgi:ATP-dependent Clp protease, protease subunit